MSLMEKRIETQERHRLVVNSFFWNEWALWKKGLRLTAQASKCACVSSGMNEPYGKKDWDIGNRCSYSMFKNRMNEPYGKKDWDEPLHCAKLQAYRLEWMSLMEKRIETFTVICDIDNDTDSWMNEPYGKKDWDPPVKSVMSWKIAGMNEPYGKKDWDCKYSWCFCPFSAD